MNDDVAHALESRLIAGYHRQVDAYERALQILERRDTVLQAEWAPELRDTLQTVAELDAALAADKGVWRATARTPGPELRIVVERLALQIQELAAKIDDEIAALVARKERLAPEIDTFIRQRSMLSAYAQQGVVE